GPGAARSAHSRLERVTAATDAGPGRPQLGPQTGASTAGGGQARAGRGGRGGGGPRRPRAGPPRDGPRACRTIAEIPIAPPQVTLKGGERSGRLATAFDRLGNVIPTAQFRWTSS